MHGQSGNLISRTAAEAAEKPRRVPLVPLARSCDLSGMHPELESACEEVAAASPRPAPRETAGCPCCTTPEELRALVETPLRALSEAQLGSYAFSALLTVGDGGTCATSGRASWSSPRGASCGRTWR